MAPTTTDQPKLREPATADNATLFREILEQHLELSNLELAEMYLIRLREEGISEAGDLGCLAQAFALEKAALRHKQAEIRGRPLAVGQDAPSSEELLLVKEWATQAGGLEKLRAKVHEVDTMAHRLGGLERLKASLEAMGRLLGEAPPEGDNL